MQHLEAERPKEVIPDDGSHILHRWRGTKGWYKDDAPMELYNRPANEFVAGFLGAPRINLVDRPGADATEPHSMLWQALAARAPNAARRAGLRPEHLAVNASGAGVPAMRGAHRHAAGGSACC